jgi:uncharacterized C2H2 Zn-finger protein
MTLRIPVSDSEVEDEITQRNLPEIEEEIGQVDQEVESSRASSIAWLCFDKSKTYKRNGKEYLKCIQPRCNREIQFNRNTSSNLVRHVRNDHSSTKV